MRLFLATISCLGIAACAQAKHSEAPKADSSKRSTRMDPLLNYLSLPEDFEKDPDVQFLGAKIREPQVLKTFYTAAAQIHGELDAIFDELAKDKQKATKVMDFNHRLVQASRTIPLTVTHIMFAVGKHLQPILDYRSETIDRLAQRVHAMDEKTIGIVNTFFNHFALPEMQVIEQFCVLMSRAKLHARPDIKTGRYLDLTGTGLIESQKRVRLDLSNFLAKVDLLLTLFLTEPTAAQRSSNLVKRLWTVHWRRWQLLNKDKEEPLESAADLFNPHNYRAEPIHFIFPDWSPDFNPDEAISKLQAKQALYFKQQEELHVVHKPAVGNNLTVWMVVLGVVMVGLSLVGIISYFIFRQRAVEM